MLWAIAAWLPWLSGVLALPLAAKLRPIPEGGTLPYSEVTTELVLFGVGIVIAYAAVAAFIIHARRNSRLERKGRWIAALFFLNGFALPLYWWRWIRSS